MAPTYHPSRNGKIVHGSSNYYPEQPRGQSACRAEPRSSAEDILRELAFVYHLTRLVKQSIEEERT